MCYTLPRNTFSPSFSLTFTFSLFAWAKYHTLFCSCYNPLLIFFYYHHKLFSWERRKMIAQMKARRALSFAFSWQRWGWRGKGLRFLRTTNCLSSFTKSNFPSVRSALLFYVNPIMYSFQRGKTLAERQKMWREELLFLEWFSFFSLFIFHQQNNNRNGILLSPTSPTNKQFFLLLRLPRFAFINVVIMAAEWSAHDGKKSLAKKNHSRYTITQFS